MALHGRNLVDPWAGGFSNYEVREWGHGFVGGRSDVGEQARHRVVYLQGGAPQVINGL